MTYTGYDPPRFNKYSDYWSTSPGGTGTGGNGLAEYSNRGFFTPLTNIGYNGNVYPSPTNSASAFTPVNAASNNPCYPGATTKLLKGTVTDTLAPGMTAAGVALSAASAWDDILASQPAGTPVYHINRFNYDAMADLLIPRAVAYSAGLIDYFFRGKMEISLPDEGVYGIVDHSVATAYTKDTGGFFNIKLKIKNTTPTIIESGTGGVIHKT